MTFTHGMAVKHVNCKALLYVEFVDGDQVTCSEFGNDGVRQTITVGAKSLEMANTDVKSCRDAPQFESGQKVTHIMAPAHPMRFEYQKPHQHPNHSIAVCSIVRGEHLVTFEFEPRSLLKYKGNQYGLPESI
ncbi:hypothetical protein ACE1B4_11580 [Aeromonas veronii]|uniref:hypothetical protein n=1 Tax=Aeromonas veronii TaxID=654 RepID=UPI00111740B7|nr:hypothetical protein [Aeromonas veronii]TNI03831.1 hypothetical protein CF135_17205 [Aeromonas veronii]HDO1310978.1 hypothetical protein [Aeromonas veronii]